MLRPGCSLARQVGLAKKQLPPQGCTYDVRKIYHGDVAAAATAALKAGQPAITAGVRMQTTLMEENRARRERQNFGMLAICGCGETALFRIPCGGARGR